LKTLKNSYITHHGDIIFTGNYNLRNDYSVISNFKLILTLRPRIRIILPMLMNMLWCKIKKTVNYRSKGEYQVIKKQKYSKVRRSCYPARSFGFWSGSFEPQQEVCTRVRTLLLQMCWELYLQDSLNVIY